MSEVSNAGAAPVETSAAESSSENNFNNTLPDAVNSVMAEAGLGSDEEIIDDGADLETPEEQLKSWKLKVDGQEIEISDEEELIKRAQMGFAADKKWQEAAETKKQVMIFLDALQNDPVAAISKMGLDMDDIAEAHIKRRIEEMEKSPEQLEQEKIRQELEQLRSEKEKQEEEVRQSEIRRIQNEYAVQIENEISEVLDTNQNLPKSPYVVKRVADVLIAEYKRGNTNIQVKDVVPFVEKQIMSEFSKMFGSMPENMFEKVVGKDILNKYRKSKVKSTQSAPKSTVNGIKSTGESERLAKTSSRQESKISSRDFFKKLGTK